MASISKYSIGGLDSEDVVIDRVPARVERFYDRSLRLWTCYPVNAAGDQLGDAEYQHYKRDTRMDVSAYRLWI
jgi:hypothetical protein